MDWLTHLYTQAWHAPPTQTSLQTKYHPSWQQHFLMVVAPSRTMHPTTRQRLLRNGSKNVTKSVNLASEFSRSQYDWVSMRCDSSSPHNPQHPEDTPPTPWCQTPKDSPRGPVSVLTGQSQVQSKDNPLWIGLSYGVQGRPTDDWAYWDLGTLEAMTHWALLHAPLADPEQFLQCGALSCWACRCPEVVHLVCMCFKWHPHKCNEMINVISRHLAVVLMLWLVGVFAEWLVDKYKPACPDWVWLKGVFVTVSDHISCQGAKDLLLRDS